MLSTDTDQIADFDALRSQLNSYKPSDAAIKLIRDSSILFLVGFAGAGKDAVIKKLLDTGEYHYVVSHTTRKQRVNHGVLEQDGQDYHFISMPEAQRMLNEHQFIEAKMYSNNIYGTSVAEIELVNREHKTGVTDIEVQGVAEYKAIDPDVKAVFLLPPSYEIWQQRLSKRYGDTMEGDDYRRRMMAALDELDQLFSTDNYVAVINDDLRQTALRVHEFVKHDKYDEVEEMTARDIARQIYTEVQHALASLR